MPASRDLLAHLTGARATGDTAPIEMVRAVPAEGATAAEIADRLAVPRQTVYRDLGPAAESLLVETSPYRRTGLGEVVLRVVGEATASPAVDLAAIATLAGSEHREQVLTALRDGPVTKRALSDGADRPSRSTVYRVVETFEKRGWAADPPTERGIVRTARGDDVAAAFDTLTTAVDQALQRRALLRYLDGRVADIPLAGLAAAEQFLHTPADPDPPLDHTNRLVAAEPATFRGFMSVVSRRAADQGDRLIRSDTDTELMITEQVLHNLPTEGHYATHVRRGLEARNFSMGVVPEIEEFPVNLAIFGGETVAIRPTKLEQSLGEAPVGSVIGADDALVAWAEELYETYHERGRSPAAQAIEELKQAISDAVGISWDRSGAE